MVAHSLEFWLSALAVLRIATAGDGLILAVRLLAGLAPLSGRIATRFVPVAVPVTPPAPAAPS